MSHMTRPGSPSSRLTRIFRQFQRALYMYANYGELTAEAGGMPAGDQFLRRSDVSFRLERRQTGGDALCFIYRYCTVMAGLVLGVSEPVLGPRILMISNLGFERLLADL